MLKSNMNHPNQEWNDKEEKGMNDMWDLQNSQEDFDSYKYQGLSEEGVEGIDKNEIGGKKTLQDIYNETGKVQTKGFCVLIDGPFLQKNPDWKNMPLQLLDYYDTMEKTVAIKNLFKNESSSAYLSEVAPISVSEFSQLAKKAKAKLENMTENFKQSLDIKEIVDEMHPFFDFKNHKAYVELVDIDSVLVYDFEIGGTPINSQDPEVGYDGDISLTFNEDESQLNNGIDEYVNYIGDEISMNPDKYRFWEKYYDEGYGEPDEPDYY